MTEKIQPAASKPCDMPGCSSYAVGDGPWCPKHQAQSLTANEADWIEGSQAMKDDPTPSETTDLHIRTWSEDGHYYAAIDELPGCIGDGPTLPAAIEDCRLASLEWLDEAERLGRVQ